MQLSPTIELPAADGLYERAVRRLPGGNSRTTLFVAPHPPYVERGEGCRLVDVEGHSVVDLQNNYTTLIHGHAHPAVVEAAIEAVRAGASFGLPTRYEVDLAELLSERLPAADLWRFTSSGTEAVMMAIRVARAHTGRDAVLRFAGCYHGTYDAMASPARGVPAAVQADVITVPVADGDAFAAAMDAHGDRLACVVLDAMPNRAGLRRADPEFVRLVRERTAQHGVVMIQDEVLTFRVAYGGLQSLYDVTPDLTTVGKVIGGGFPVGAVGGVAEIMEAFDPRRADAVGHGGTFSANPVTMRAGLAAMQLLNRSEIDRINALGERFRNRLSEQGWTVTGGGSLARIHVEDPTALWWQLYAEGILIAANGLACMSTAMDEPVVDEVCEAFARVAA